MFTMCSDEYRLHRHPLALLKRFVGGSANGRSEEFHSSRPEGFLRIPDGPHPEKILQRCAAGCRVQQRRPWLAKSPRRTLLPTPGTTHRAACLKAAAGGRRRRRSAAAVRRDGCGNRLRPPRNRKQLIAFRTRRDEEKRTDDSSGG